MGVVIGIWNINIPVIQENWRTFIPAKTTETRWPGQVDEFLAIALTHNLRYLSSLRTWVRNGSLEKTGPFSAMVGNFNTFL